MALALLFGTLLSPAALHAQSVFISSKWNDSTLRNIKTVTLLVVDADSSAVSVPSVSLQSYAELELRKAGIRVVPIGQGDATISVDFFARRRAFTNDLELHWRVTQPVTMLRTGQTLWLPTWWFEERAETADPSKTAGQQMVAAVDAFLTKWLDQNGR